MFDHLCLDWGEKRCGLAFGDSVSGLILLYKNDLPTFDLEKVLEKEITGRKIRVLVVGRPTNFFMKETQVTGRIENFVNQLQLVFPNLKIVFENERNSSKQAKNQGIKVDKFNINHLAAMNILENYFSKESRM